MRQIVAISALLAAAAVAGAAPQKHVNPPKPPPKAPRVAERTRPMPRATSERGVPRPGRGPERLVMPRPDNRARPLPNPLNPGQRFLQMTPQEQEIFIEQANPALQQRLREALDRYNHLPERARQRIFRQFQLLNALPPEKQALLHRQINRFNAQPEDRRATMAEELLKLRAMSPQDRADRLSSDDFKSRFTADERQILGDLSENLPPEYLQPR
jgi:hypothetical protein